MERISSSSVRVFPSSARPDYPESKLASEYNFINIINSLIDVDGYVVSHTGGKLKFVIHGYYFDIEYSASPSNLWACIYVETGNNQRLISTDSTTAKLDDKDKFTGLMLNESNSFDAPPSGAKAYPLCIYSNDELNKLRFSGESVFYGSDQTSPKKDLNTLLDSKQNNLDATNTTGKGFGLAVAKNSGTNTSKIEFNENTKNLLDSMYSAGSVDTPIYFKDGKATKITVNAGSKWDGSTGTESVAYVKDGQIQKGFTIFASSSQPNNAADGDIWFKIK